MKKIMNEIKEMIESMELDGNFEITKLFNLCNSVGYYRLDKAFAEDTINVEEIKSAVVESAIKLESLLNEIDTEGRNEYPDDFKIYMNLFINYYNMTNDAKYELHQSPFEKEHFDLVFVKNDTPMTIRIKFEDTINNL